MADADLYFDPAALAELFASEPVAKELQRRAVKVETAAKRLAPVDTGRLRANITNALGRDGEGLFADIGSDVEYAIYVELGTRHTPAQPYLRPALGAAGA